MEKMEGHWLKAYFDYFLGQKDESLSEYSAIKEQAERVGAGFLAAVTDWITGYLQSERSEFDPARQAFQAYTDYFMKRNPAAQTFMNALHSFVFGWVDLKQGRLDSAKARLKEIESLLPKVGSGNEEFMTLLSRLLEAEVLLSENSPQKAAEAGEKIVPEKFPSMTTSRLTLYNIPFLKDVLARAYWKNGDLDKAIAEYQRLTTIDPKNQIRYLIHPLYHYRLGRVYEDKGDKTKAATEYRKFLEYWKDADPKHPELSDARKRLESLQ
jgi:tetratricopeptide (TPR) repeat protein